jgi:predicted CoA-substrate-specific enzyme activase
MRYAGIDIGSRSIELVVVDDAGAVAVSRCADTGYDPIREAKQLIDCTAYDRILATGYGRNLFEIAFDAPTVTEIKAHARGARSFFPDVNTVLDIGGQDSKAISLLENGRVRKFELNDRCAAGTGKFLEIMARTLGYDIEEFGREALMEQKLGCEVLVPEHPQFVGAWEKADQELLQIGQMRWPIRLIDRAKGLKINL